MDLYFTSFYVLSWARSLSIIANGICKLLLTILYKYWGLMQPLIMFLSKDSFRKLLHKKKSSFMSIFLYLIIKLLKSCYFEYLIKFIGSVTLSGLMLGLGLLKIIWGSFFLFLAPARGSYPAGPYPNSFFNPAR